MSGILSPTALCERALSQDAIEIDGCQFDNRQAKAEGWMLYLPVRGDTVRFRDYYGMLGKTAPVLTKYVRHVFAKAMEGSEYHVMALMFVRNHDPEHFAFLKSVLDHGRETDRLGTNRLENGDSK